MANAATFFCDGTGRILARPTPKGLLRGLGSGFKISRSAERSIMRADGVGVGASASSVSVNTTRDGIESGAAVCSVDKAAAEEFNTCLFRVGTMEYEEAQRCLEVAKDINSNTAEEQGCEICSEEVCADKAYLNWFISFISNTFGM